MAKMKLKCCPFCGGKAHWCKGGSDTGMSDCVQCHTCFAEIEGTHEPMSALKAWNTRIAFEPAHANDTEVEC